MEKHFDIVKDVPFIHNTDELQEWMQPLYIIDNIMVSKDNYEKFMKIHMNLLRGCFDIRECREMDIRFKFYQNDKQEHTLQFRHFMVNMILWGPFVELHGIHVLNEGFILDCFTQAPKVEDYINMKLINILRFYRVKSTKVNQYISEVLHGLRNISIDFSIIMGCNFSIVTFLKMYQEYPEIRDIMETTFAENMQPYEIESELAEIQDKMISFIKKIPNNPIGTILTAGSGMKTKQLTEFVASEGLKPSLEGQTIPIPIENSTLLRGLDRPSYLYIDAIGARKSLVINYLLPRMVTYVSKTSLIAGNSW